MDGLKIVAIVLIVLGILGLAYGGFTYNSPHSTEFLGITLTHNEKETVNIPLWAGVGAIVIGGALLVFGLKRR
jgi:TRAP-type C4-dicarboxylate transport system permease small subunit